MHALDFLLLLLVVVLLLILFLQPNLSNKRERERDTQQNDENSALRWRISVSFQYRTLYGTYFEKWCKPFARHYRTIQWKGEALFFFSTFAFMIIMNANRIKWTELFLHSFFIIWLSRIRYVSTFLGIFYCKFRIKFWWIFFRCKKVKRVKWLILMILRSAIGSCVSVCAIEIFGI